MFLPSPFNAFFSSHTNSVLCCNKLLVAHDDDVSEIDHKISGNAPENCLLIIRHRANVQKVRASSSSTSWTSSSAQRHYCHATKLANEASPLIFPVFINDDGGIRSPGSEWVTMKYVEEEKTTHAGHRKVQYKLSTNYVTWENKFLYLRHQEQQQVALTVIQ